MAFSFVRFCSAVLLRNLFEELTEQGLLCANIYQEGLAVRADRSGDWRRSASAAPG
jgi:hypothetical protein